MHRTHAGHGSIWPSEAVEARASDQSTLTPERIAELRALLAQIPPNYWRAGEIRHAGAYQLVEYDGRSQGYVCEVQASIVKNNLAEDERQALVCFIVAMRNALPALLDRLEKAEGELAEAREDVRSLCRFILNEWGPDGALKATTFALEQRQSAKGGDANAAPDRDTNSKSATSPGVTAGASAGWQSIETAPKDGTRILLGCFATEFRERLGHTAVDYWHSLIAGDNFDGWGRFNAAFWPPTHWMPLPTTPVNGGKSE